MTEKMSPTDEVWEQEEVVFEGGGAPLVVLPEVEAVSPAERDKGDISVTDMKTASVIKHRVQEAESDKEFFVRTIESLAEESLAERKDSSSDRKDVSHRAVVTSELTIETESRDSREKPEEEVKLVRDVGTGREAEPGDKPSQVISTQTSMKTEARAVSDSTNTSVKKHALAEGGLKPKLLGPSVTDMGLQRPKVTESQPEHKKPDDAKDVPLQGLEQTKEPLLLIKTKMPPEKDKKQIPPQASSRGTKKV